MSTRNAVETTSPLKLLLMGLIPTSSEIPQWSLDLYGSAADIEAKIQTDAARLRNAGHDITLYYFDDKDPQKGLKWLEAKLRAESFHGIQIGSGLRLLQQHMILFEEVVAICHTLAPASQLLFNGGPGTSWNAVARNEERMRNTQL